VLDAQPVLDELYSVGGGRVGHGALLSEYADEKDVKDHAKAEAGQTGDGENSESFEKVLHGLGPPVIGSQSIYL
jgi:hypothetical protein